MIKIKSFFSSVLLSSISLFMHGQGVTQCGIPTGQRVFPVESYIELSDPFVPLPQQWALVKQPCVSWGSTDIRYAKYRIPTQNVRKNIILAGWRGEKVHAQAIVWTNVAIDKLNYSFTEFKDAKGNVIPEDAFGGGFVRYVMTDELNKDGRGACGPRTDHTMYDSLLVADGIDHLLESIPLEKMSTRAIWVNCQIPRAAIPGLYKGAVIVKDGTKTLAVLGLAIRVSSHILPAPSEWAYHLDLWQNPYAVARYYQVPLWSQEHINAMRPIMKMLADAGQKVITATIMHKPWNGQTHDYFESMVTWMRKVDGTWEFDYSVFDKWVEFMRSIGICKQINCYSMVPWELSFQYFDQASNRMQFIRTTPGESKYEEIWVAMLSSFSKHLREKGWFDICAIAMDERPMEVMQKTLKVIYKADPKFKVSLAGNFHGEIEPYLYDYCISIGQNFPENVKNHRCTEGKLTTSYTSCAEAFPNTFTFSAPAEATWISYYLARNHLDGYLRWAYNSWPKEPLLDSRYKSFAAGDTYLIYPGARSSIRFEKLIEGIQDHEKITILRRNFANTGNKNGLKKIEKLLSLFNLSDFPEVPAEETVNRAKRILETL